MATKTLITSGEDQLKEKLATENLVEEEQPQAPESPEERYKKTLTTLKITEADAMLILDAIVEKGFYEKEYSIFKGKVRIAFRTRDGKALQRAAENLDDISTNDPRVHNERLNRVNLIGSLARYQDEVFKPLTSYKDPAKKSQEYLRRSEFIEEIPAPILEIVYGKLRDFDMLVFGVTSNGAVEGF